MKEINRRWRVKIVRETLEAYGGVRCACCGETEITMLTLDHVDQDGARHRREGQQRGSLFYAELRAQKFPKGYRVLCWNCNHAVYRSPDHRCPHGTGVFAEA